MSSRLSTISERLPNRIQKMKELHPLSRSALLNSLFGEKYAKIRDECFDVMINNPNIFKHADTEDSSFN